MGCFLKLFGLNKDPQGPLSDQLELKISVLPFDLNSLTDPKFNKISGLEYLQNLGELGLVQLSSEQISAESIVFKLISNPGKRAHLSLTFSLKASALRKKKSQFFNLQRMEFPTRALIF